MERSDDDSESDLYQQCVSEINKYKQCKSKTPTIGNYPDALFWWKKSAVILPYLALIAQNKTLYSGHISTI